MSTDPLCSSALQSSARESPSSIGSGCGSSYSRKWHARSSPHCSLSSPRLRCRRAMLAVCAIFIVILMSMALSVAAAEAESAPAGATAPAAAAAKGGHTLRAAARGVETGAGDSRRPDADEGPVAVFRISGFSPFNFPLPWRLFSRPSKDDAEKHDLDVAARQADDQFGAARFGQYGGFGGFGGFGGLGGFGASGSVRSAGGGGLLSEFLQSFAGLGDIEDQVFHMPSMFKDSLSRANALGKTEYGYSDDKKFLLVNFSLPSLSGDDSTGANVERKIFAAVLGDGGHLRVKIDKVSAGQQTYSSVRVISLPVRVTKEGMEIVTNPDGSMTVKLKVIGEKSSHGSFVSSELSSASIGSGGGIGSVRSESFLSNGDADAQGNSHAEKRQSRESESGDDVNSSDSLEGVDNKDAVKECRRRYLGAGYKLMAQQCVCKAKTSDDSRAICFGNLLSSAIRIARRLNMDDFATDAKHTAIDCAYKDAKAACLEAITDKALVAVYGDVAKGEQKELPDRLRAAIESEDRGPSKKEGGSIFGSLLALFIVIACICIVFALRVLRANQLMSPFNPTTAATASQRTRGTSPRGELSGVLSQLGGRGGPGGSNGNGGGSSTVQRMPSKLA